jgi:pentatricopeptide repeat protein
MQSHSLRAFSLASLDFLSTAVISAYARAGNAERAEALLDTMLKDYQRGNKSAKPDFKSFDIVINAWAGWGDKDPSPMDAWQAEKVLRRMWLLHDNGGLKQVRPTADVYKRIIVAYKKAGNPGRAEMMLSEMEQYYERGQLNERPTKQLYQAVINAWNDSSHHDKQLSIRRLRRKMNSGFSRKTNHRGGSRHYNN